ncbi:hypothetical protein B6V73_00030 [Thioclava sp. JM3]|nr:hypothetical protein B6V73_00030 [Thioclava sp. JM3]
MEWLVDHHRVVGIAVQLVTRFVWGAYLQRMLQNFRRERRSKLLMRRPNLSAPSESAQTLHYLRNLRQGRSPDQDTLAEYPPVRS